MSSWARTGAGRNSDGVLRQGSIHNLDDFLTPENADNVIDAGDFLEQLVLPALGETAGDDDGPDATLRLEGEHLADDGERFLARGFDEAARVDDDDVGAFGVGDKSVAVLSQLAEHPFRIDGVLGATEANEGERSFCMH